MRSLLPLAMVLTGCSAGDFGSVYDVQHSKYPGDPGAGAVIGAGDNSSVDANVCVAQGHASVAGTFIGATFAPKDAVELLDATTNTFVINVTDYPSACTLGEDVHAGSSVISIVYTQPLLSAGALDVTSTPALSIRHVAYDSSCRPTKTSAAVSGTVTFTKVDACGAQGSFDLMFGTDHVTASFNASVCSVSGSPGACH